uniref:Uncharacterized protein n=1 Tax=Anopheles darlingi TaxID=43151 RepID=A0A2M4DR09_ANODA
MFAYATANRPYGDAVVIFLVCSGCWVAGAVFGRRDGFGIGVGGALFWFVFRGSVSGGCSMLGACACSGFWSARASLRVVGWWYPFPGPFAIIASLSSSTFLL